MSICMKLIRELIILFVVLITLTALKSESFLYMIISNHFAAQSTISFLISNLI